MWSSQILHIFNVQNTCLTSGSSLLAFSSISTKYKPKIDCNNKINKNWKTKRQLHIEFYFTSISKCAAKCRNQPNGQLTIESWGCAMELQGTIQYNTLYYRFKTSSNSQSNNAIYASSRTQVFYRSLKSCDVLYRHIDSCDIRYLLYHYLPNV